MIVKQLWLICVGGPAVCAFSLRACGTEGIFILCETSGIVVACQRCGGNRCFSI